MMRVVIVAVLIGAAVFAGIYFVALRSSDAPEATRPATAAQAPPGNVQRDQGEGGVEIEVTFHISADGIVSVKAKDLETSLEQSITVTATSGLTEDEIRSMVDENKDYMLEVRSSQEFEKHKQQAEKVLDEIEGLFPKVSEIISGSDFGRDAVQKARTVCEKARQAITAKDMAAVVDSSEALTRTLNMFKGVVSKTRTG